MTLKIRKFITLLAMALVLIVPPVAAQGPYKVGAAVYGLRGDFMQMWVNRLKAHPAVQDGTVEITVFDGRYDAMTQSNQFDTMITQRYDGILFVPIDIEAGAEAVEKAFDAGIPVVGSNARVHSEKLTSYVGNDDTISGAMQTEIALEKIGGRGNVVIIEGPIGQSGQVERLKGNLAVLARYPEVRLLERKTANWSRAESLALMENWLTAHAGRINAVIGQNDEMALGAIEAIKSNGLSTQSITVVGIDGTVDAVRSVQAGDLEASILQDSNAQAQGALDVLLRHIIGPEYQPRSTMWEEYAGTGLVWGDGTAKLYDVPWTAITKENAADILQKLQ